MELTALRRKFSQWSDEESQDFIGLLESIDEFREQAELLELDLRSKVVNKAKSGQVLRSRVINQRQE